MTIANDNASLAARLRRAYTHARRNIKLPDSIDFVQDGHTVRMHMKPTCVEANMQDNQSTFEGWALALKCWLPDAEHIELTWDAVAPDDPHYQRFLYRANRFHQLFDWFSVSSSVKDEITKLKTDDSSRKYYLNDPSPDRNSDSLHVDISLASCSEHELETFIIQNPHTLTTILPTLKYMDRQRPVGVFRDRVKQVKEHVIFPGRKAAIDIWGTDAARKNLFLFELKAAGEYPMGILSEMFFYSFVMEDVQRHHFLLNTPDEHMPTKASIQTYILATEWHPLIDSRMIQLINRAFSDKQRPIRFGAVEIKSLEDFRVAIPCESPDSA